MNKHSFAPRDSWHIKLVTIGLIGILILITPLSVFNAIGVAADTDNTTPKVQQISDNTTPELPPLPSDNTTLEIPSQSDNATPEITPSSDNTSLEIPVSSDNTTPEPTIPSDNVTPEIPMVSDNVTPETSIVDSTLPEPDTTETEIALDEEPSEEDVFENQPTSDDDNTETEGSSDNTTSEQAPASDNITPELPQLDIKQNDKVVKPEEEGYLVSGDGRINLRVPEGAVAEATRFEIIDHISPGAAQDGMVSFFELKASIAGLREEAIGPDKPSSSDNLTPSGEIKRFNKELEITIQHTPKELKGLDLDSLHLYYLDEVTRQWVLVPTSSFNVDNLTLTATIEHFSYYGEQANPLQNGPGRVMAAEVDLHSGAATFSYPFELPPGPGGFQPSLNLNYNSGSVDGMKNKRSMGSWVGIGWSLHLGRITCDLSTDTYYLDLNGASYKLYSSNSTEYHTNPEQYFKITRSGNTWEVLDREGNYYRFGGTTDSEQYLYDASKQYYRWDLSQIEDTNGNTATVSYAQEIRGTSPTDTVRAAYPQYLTYSNVQVQFFTGYDETDETDGNLRYDNPKTYDSNPAPKTMETRRLDAIEIEVSSNIIRKYEFYYTTDNRVYSSDYSGIYYSGKHKLDSITQIGSDNTSALPAISFSYQDKNVYRKTGETQYSGNPGNPASLTWPFLITINSGYGGTISFNYTQIPDTSVFNYWTRQAVTAKTINSGIGTAETYTYTYTGTPWYNGTGWDQEFRGWREVIVIDAANNYIKHYFYTTGMVGDTDTELLTGKEYNTKWYDSSDNLLKEKDYDWEPYVVGNSNLTVTLRPNGAGDTTQLTPSPSAPNWDCVDESGDGDGLGTIVEAVYNDQDWEQDLYSLPNQYECGIITSLRVYIRHIRGDMNTNVNTNGKGRTVMKTNGAEYYGNPINPGPYAFVLSYTTYSTNPNTGEGWTINEIYALQAGYSGFLYTISPYKSWGRCTQVWVEVDFSQRYAVKLNKVEETDYNATSGSKTSRIEYVYDDYGNIITEKIHGDISTNDDDATVHRTFYPNTSANILNKPARERVYATITADVGGSNLKKEALFYYDGNNTSLTTPPTEGNLTRHQVSANATASVSSYFTYDGYGNMLTSQDPNGNTITWTYETTHHTYPATKTLPNGQSENYTYDVGTSNLLSVIDFNGQTTTYQYDTFKRLISIDKPLGRNPDITYEYLDWGTLNQQRIYTKTYFDETNYIWQSDYFDGLGRVIQTHSSGETDNITIVSNTITFNNRGLLEVECVNQSFNTDNISGYKSPTAISADWLEDWANRVEIIIDYNKIDSSLTHFPVLLHLSENCGQDSDNLTAVFDELGDNSKKIAVTTYSGTQLYVEIEKWDSANEEAWLWVSKSGWQISSVEETILYLYYDNNHDDNTAYVGVPGSTPAQNVWDSNFVLVDHMQDDPSTSYTRDSVTNSTGSKIAADEPVEATGQIGDAQDFDGTDDYISYGDVHDFGTGDQMTLEVIIKTEDVADYQVAIAKYNVPWNSIFYFLGTAQTTGKVWFRIGDGSSGPYVISDSSVTDGSYHFLTGVRDVASDVIRVYVDGEEDATPVEDTTGDLSNNGQFRIGRTSIDNYPFDGIIDAVRVSDIARSAGWLKATYNTGIDNLVSFGDSEEAEESIIWKGVSYTYDALGRVITMTNANNTTFTHDYSNAWQDLVNNQRGYKTRYHYDAFNQLTKVEELSENQTVYATTEYLYDVLGNLIEVEDEDGNTTDMTYDWLSRKTAMTDPDMGSWSYVYDNNGNLTSQTDARSQNITMTYDALNRLIEKDYSSANMTDIEYVYDDTNGGNFGKGLRTSMNDAVRTTRYMYDARGRLVREIREIADLGGLEGWDNRIMLNIDCSEIVNDLTHFPVLVHLSDDCGQTEYDVTQVFDELSDNYTRIAVTQDDGMSQLYVEIEGWDSLNEEAWLWVSSENWTISSSSNTTIYMYYDNDQDDNTEYVGTSNSTAAENVWDGYYQLVSNWFKATSYTGSDDLCTYSDPFVTYTTSFEYDGANRITKIIYPTGENVSQEYNGRGLPYALSGSVVGDIVESTLYNSLGMTTEINLGNGLQTTFGYWNTGGDYDTTGGYYGQLWRIRTTDGETDLMDVRHTWDAGGNLVNRYDAVSTDNETFSYDFLDRLTGVSGAYTESYTYNEIGNILSRNGVSYTYDGTQPHAVDSVGAASYVYDANGNMTNRNGQTIVWDAENRPVSVSANGTSTTFIYDGDGNRVMKTEGGETILYINKYYEVNLTTGNTTSYYYLGGKLVAMSENTTLRYVHKDHLSGTSLMTDTTGDQAGTTMKYLPFGGTRSGSVPTDKLFTGQRLDGTGLYYYNARYYDPTIGRFISPDTIVPHPINPQSFNRYSYCQNNPLKYTDPSGNDYYLALVQYFENKPQASHYGDIDSFAGDMIAWGNELGEIQKAYRIESRPETSLPIDESYQLIPQEPSPSSPAFPYPSVSSNTAPEQPPLPIGNNDNPLPQPATNTNHSGEARDEKHGLPVWEKVILTIEATCAIGLFIGVAGAATVAAPPAGIILIPAAIGAGWAWWMIVSTTWRSE